MTRPRPQSSGKGLRVVSFEAEEENERSVLSTASSDLHLYQCVLFLLTQIGYIAVVPSMLSTTFFEPTMDFCANIDPSQNLTKPVDAANLFSGIVLLENEEFYSLLVEWEEHCRFSPWTVWASTSVMLGAIFGSFAAGFLADRFGRKPVVVVSMSLICLGNFLLALLGNFSHISAMFVFFFIGTACGGYLVTNMVLLVEILRNSSTRLLVVSLNGWPLGMIATAFLAYILRHWRVYHLAIGTISLGFATIIHYFASESIPWLIQSGKDRKAQLTQQRLTGLNSLLSLTKESAADSARSKGNNNNDDGLVAFLGNNNDKTAADDALSPSIAAAVDSAATIVLYTYADLFRFRSIRVRLLTLLFCFGASSIISFGLYFSADVLPGSRYTNIAVMGLSKLALGFLPFLLSSCMGRRPILLSSIGLAMLAAWALIAAKLFLVVDNLWIVTALGLFMTGAIDPNWKIIHLLSIELFPTPVRNMARALCNVVARLGSLSGPWVLFLRSYNELLPFWVFAVLLSLQLLVSFCFLPETREKPLPDEMPVDEDKVRTFRRRTSSKHSVHSAHSVDFAIV